MSKESSLVRSIVDALQREYPTAWVFKVVGSPYQMSGVPDLLVCAEGRLVGLEVKFPRPGESPERTRDRATALQRFQIEGIRRAGGAAGVVTSVDEALKLVEESLPRATL